MEVFSHNDGRILPALAVLSAVFGVPLVVFVIVVGYRCVTRKRRKLTRPTGNGQGLQLYYIIIKVFRLDALALSVIATATWLAGWLGGWLAVTLRYCIKTAKPIGKLFRPSESPITLVF